MDQNILDDQIQVDLDLKLIITQIVDYMLQELTPFEITFYLFLLKNTYIEKGLPNLRIGKRTIGGKIKGSRSENTNYSHITTVLKSLELKGCIKIGDPAKQGTLYTVILPQYIPFVMAKINDTNMTQDNGDYFRDPEKRKMIFERDQWICQYCGEEVDEDNATLDHYIPQSNKGEDSAENLKTCCLMCNSLKSGRSYDEAAPLILKSIQERRRRTV